MRKGFGEFAAILTIAAATVPVVANADGLEFAGAGARGTMRGGAYLVGSDDSMALLYNPANLANTQGMQLHASVGLLFYSLCYDRDGTYGSSPMGANRGGSSAGSPDQYGSSATATDQETGLPDGSGGTLSFDDARGFATPEVCNTHRVNVVPELAYSWRINERFGLGVGVVAPTAPGNLAFGDRIGGREGMVRTANGAVLPGPNRYMLVGQNALIAFPTIGLGVQVADKIRVGASFGWGFGSIEFRTFAAPFFTENFGTDIYAVAKVHDAFIPRITAGVSGGPWNGVSFGAQFTYVGDLNASGRIDAQSMYLYDQSARAGFRTHENIPVAIQTQLPMQTMLGVRYGAERVGVTLPEDAVGDSMDTETWNIEANLGYTFSSRVSGFAIDPGQTTLPAGYDTSLPPNDPANSSIYPCGALIDPASSTVPGCVQVMNGLPAAIPDTFPAPIRHNWKNQITFRLGGDYNVVPGRLSLSGGLSMDSNGQQRGYEQLDFQPYRRVGTHLGFSVRVGRVDINVAYAHHFNQTRTNSYGTACPDLYPGGDMNGDGDNHDANEQASCNFGDQTQWGVQPLAATAVNQSDVANSGRFKSHLDVLQLGVTYHIR